MLEIKSAALTHPGRKRRSNQDFVTYFEPESADDLRASGRVYLLADGVGGASMGERASQYAAQQVLYEYYRHPNQHPGDRLQQFMRQAGNEIFAFAEQGDIPRRMATTMVAAVVRDGLLTVANVGDSRAYLIRDGAVTQITRDHSIVGEMIRDGEISEEQARQSKIKNRLTRSLGGEPDAHVDLFRDIHLRPGDKVLLCSDGLTRYTNREGIPRLVQGGSPEEVVERLVDFANRQGGADNISAILVEVGAQVSELPTLRVGARGTAPAPVDWDSMQTMPLAPPTGRPRAKPSRNTLLALGAAGAFALLVFIIGLALWPRLIEKFSPTPSPSPSLENTNSAAALPPSMPPEPLHTLTPIPTSTPLPTETPTQTATPTLPLSPSPTPESTTQVPVDPRQNQVFGLCAYTITREKLEERHIFDPDAFLVARDIFGRQFSSMEAFRQYAATNISCPQTGDLLCEYDPGKPHFVKEGWTLVFSEIPIATCSEVGGVPTPAP